MEIDTSDKREKLDMYENPNDETLDMTNLGKQIGLIFDYEINNIKLDEQIKGDSLNSKMYYYDKEYKSNRIINYNNFKDSLKINPYKAPTSNVYKACFIKRLVSKKKIRFQSPEFDLDMAYITERVIAMGFPSIGCEKFYRNSITDVIAFFERYHKSNVKIYNLCLEKDRIYDKSLFSQSKVALFPSLDHNPCSVKLILEFCVDICLFLIQNVESVAAVHCKAGKGRTGVMICSYLLFSGLCKTTNDALEYYGKMRTLNCRGVTIPSQIRYIKYFETFLISNFYTPYIYLIPKIIKEHLFIKGQKKYYIKNLLINLQEDSRYYKSPNFFRVNSIKIGPLDSGKDININITTFTKRELSFPRATRKFICENNMHKEKTGIYFIYETNEKLYPINSDIKIIFSKGISFYICLNLWYSSLEILELFCEKKNNNNINNVNNKHYTGNLILEGKNIYTKKNISQEIEMTAIDMSYEKFKRNYSINSKKNRKDFIIFNEDDIDFTGNRKKSISEVINEDEDNSNTMYSITSSIQHNAELNTVINDLNAIREKKNKPLFDKSNMTLNFKASQLDKFSKKKKMTNLTVKINYSLK